MAISRIIRGSFVELFSLDALRIVDANSLVSRFAHGAFWSIWGAIISRGLTLLASIVIARILGQVGFGALGMIQSTVGTVGTFAGLGLGMAATKYTAEFRVINPIKAGKILALSTIVSFVAAIIVSISLIVFAPLLAQQTLNNPLLTTPLRISSGLVFLGVVNGVQTGALAGLEAFRSIARVNLFAGIVSFPLTVAGTWVFGINGAVVGLVLSMGANCWFNSRALRVKCMDARVPYRIPYIFSDCWSERLILWKFTLPAALSVLLVAPVIWVSNVLLVNQANGYAEMGTFCAAQQWQAAILFLPISIAPMLLSMLSNAHSEDRSRSFWKMVKLSFMINCVLAGGAAFVVSILSRWIMGFYGKSFTEGWLVLTFMAVTAFLIAVINVIGQVIASSASMWWGFILNLLWAISFLVFSSVLIRSHGSTGLAASYAASYLCHLFWTSLYLYKLKHRK